MSLDTPPFWSPVSFAAITRGDWLAPPGNPLETITGIGIDTRTLEPGQAYVAIAGERFDGHDFLAQAQLAGARLALVERAPGANELLDPTDGTPLAVLRVDSTVNALQALASRYRDLLGAGGCRVISVSGSNGKTTTRHLIHHVLTHAGLTGTQSPKSFNNHLGVPLTLLGARPEHDFVTCEVGTNHPGEIAALSALVRPDIAVVTGVGEEHLEFFGDLRGVAREESALLPWVAAGGTALLPAEHRLPVPLDLPAEAPAEIRRFDLDPLADALPLPGEHNRLNASAAAAVARLFGVADAAIGAALTTAGHAPMRGEVLFAQDPARPTVINDAYNANPSSMRAALTMLQGWQAPRVAILGDMLELGDSAAAAHRTIAELATRIAGRCIFIGPQFAEALAEMAPDAGAGTGRLSVEAAWSEDIADRVAASLEPGEVVLIKGSRGLALERLLPAIERRFGGGVEP